MSSKFTCRHVSITLLAAAMMLAASSGCLSPGSQTRDQGFGLQLRQPSPDQIDSRKRESDARASADQEPTWEESFSEALDRWTGAAPDHAYARQTFADAEKLYNSAAYARQQAGRLGTGLDDAGEFYLAAAESYAEAAEKWPDSALQEDAWFMSGESYFFIDYYDKANDQYERLLKDYPNSRYMDTVQRRRFAIAQYWIKEAELADRSFAHFNLFDESRPLRDSYNTGIRILDQIRIQDPTGEIADDATMAAAVALLKTKSYGRADVILTDLRKTFPGSSHQFMAHFLGIDTKLRSYQGPHYDGGVLVEALELVKQVRRQFPQQAKQRQQDLVKMEAEIRFHQAQREWTVAVFYQKRSEIGAARIYYASIIKDYPDTPFAKLAQARLHEIADLPARPAQPLSWLVNLFPVEEPATPLITSD